MKKKIISLTIVMLYSLTSIAGDIYLRIITTARGPIKMLYIYRNGSVIPVIYTATGKPSTIVVPSNDPGCAIGLNYNDPTHFSNMGVNIDSYNNTLEIYTTVVQGKYQVLTLRAYHTDPKSWR